MSKYNEERLGKIVELARKGSPGEKENAQRILQKLCDKYDLNYDDVLKGREQLVEARVACKRTHKKFVSSIIYKYGYPDDLKRDLYWNRWSKDFYWTTTPEKQMEALNAVSVLTAAYDKERAKAMQALFYGFLEKHDLYFQAREDEERNTRSRRMSSDEWEARRMGSKMAANMDDAHIRKQLKGR